MSYQIGERVRFGMPDSASDGTVIGKIYASPEALYQIDLDGVAVPYWLKEESLAGLEPVLAATATLGGDAGDDLTPVGDGAAFGLAGILRMEAGYDATERLLGLLIELEAGGEEQMGQVAVAWTVRNRVERPRWWGTNYPDVMWKPDQYTPIHDLNEAGELLAAVSTRETEGTPLALWIARGVRSGWIPDPTDGATHYYAPALLPEPPPWASSPKMSDRGTIGGHVFFRED